MVLLMNIHTKTMLKKNIKKIVSALLIAITLAPTLAFAQLSSGGGLSSENFFRKEGSALRTIPDGQDLGTVANPIGDIYAGSLNVSGISLTGNLTFPDDVFAVFGDDGEVKIGVDTTDANAHALNIGVGDAGSNNVPVAHFGRASDIIGIDKADGDAETRARLYFWDNALAKVAKFGWGTNYFEFSSGSSAQQYYFGPTLNTNQVIVANDSQLALGGTSTFSMKRNVVFGDNDVRFSLGTEPIVITPPANVNSDFGKGVAARPKIYLTSETAFSTSTAQWVSLEHNTADFVLATGTGDVSLEPVSNVTRINGSLYLDEQSAANADTAGRGQFWVRDDTPNVAMFTDDTGTDYELATTAQTNYAEAYDFDNTDAYVVNANNEWHGYHSNGVAGDDLEGWTFDAGGAGTSHAINSIADAGGGDITVTTGTAHGLAVGDIVSQTNLTDPAYVGFFEVLTVPTTTTYTVTATFTATDTGTMDQPFNLVAGAGAAGKYEIHWFASGTSATSNETFDFALYNNDTQVTASETRRKFGTAGDVGSFAGGAVETFADGDKLSFALKNITGSNNITIRYLTVFLTRL